MKKISRFILIFILILILLFVIFWAFTIIKCEYLTFSHRNEFLNIKEVNFSSMFRILDYNGDYAKLYCINFAGNNAHVYTFKKENGKWKCDKCLETVWSKYGTADGFIWPYGR